MFRYRVLAVILKAAFFITAFNMFGKNSFAQQKNKTDSTVVFGNSTVILKYHGGNDTVVSKDPVTGKLKKRIVFIYAPVMINSTPVHKDRAPYHVSNEIEKNIINEIKSDNKLKALPDGLLRIGLNNIVIGSDGSIVYYNLSSARFKESDGLFRPLALDDFKHILASTRYAPERLKEKYVLLDVNLSRYKFSIRNGNVFASH